MIGILMLLFSLCLLAGCSHKVIITAETYTLEAGTELPESPETYASFANAELAAEAIVQADQVDTGKVGTYEAAVVLNGKAYPFAVEVVDTRAPEGSLGEWFVLSNEAVMSDSFLSECTDASEITIGFRNIELMKGQEELAALFQQELTYQEDFLISDFLGLSWEFEKDSWEEQGTELDNLEETFEAEKDGLYSLELVAADEYGNASVIRCYALIDRTAPILSGVEDTEIALNRNTDVDTLTTDGVSAEDNLLGDITASILIEEEILESSDTHLKAKVIYTVTDLCGNVATAERVMEIKVGNDGQALGVGSQGQASATSVKDAEARAVAQAIADSIPTGSDLERVRAAADAVAGYCSQAVYTTEDPDYSTAYGVFCKGVYTCAGSTRALGLVLDCMGYSWVHANPNQWTHQWCELIMDGQAGWADGMGGIADYGACPFATGGTYTAPDGRAWRAG